MSVIKARILFGARLRGVTALVRLALREIFASRTTKFIARHYWGRKPATSLGPQGHCHAVTKIKPAKVMPLSRVRNGRIYVLTPGFAVWLVSVPNLHNSYRPQDSNHGETNDQEHH